MELLIARRIVTLAIINRGMKKCHKDPLTRKTYSLINTDYFCSFCAEVEAATSTEFFKNDYIKSGKVRYEHRVVTLLKEMTNNTETGAHAAFCAADQDKYWQYTHDIVPRIKSDYFDKGIGVKKRCCAEKKSLLFRWNIS